MTLESAVRALQPQAPPLLLRIDRREDITAQTFEWLASTLAPQEWHRHDAYRLQADRERFLLGRGMLRQLLGLWLNQPPHAVTLAMGPHGKPFCPDGPEFNLSHSGDLVLVALHPCRPVGVDVEQLRPDLDWRPIARRMFEARVTRQLLSRPEPEQCPAFLQHWCRLEAKLKAAGQGLASASLKDQRESGCRYWTLDLPDGYVGFAVQLTHPGG